MNTDSAAETKATAKELQQQQTDTEKPKAQPETPKTPSLPTVTTINGFNTEDFLARVNMNEKINNILRSPTKTPNGVRQRSVFTAITPSSVSKFLYRLHKHIFTSCSKQNVYMVVSFFRTKHKIVPF